MTTDQLFAENRRLRSLLGDCHDYLEDCADVNHDGDGPNQAMVLAASIRELLDAKESA